MHMDKHGEWCEDEGDQQGFPSREDGPKLIRFESPRWRPKNNSSSSSPRSPGAAHTKNDAQVAYGVCFGRSLYGWKDNFKELTMALVSGPNSLGINGNHRNNVTSRICQGLRHRLLGCCPMYRVGPSGPSGGCPLGHHQQP